MTSFQDKIQQKVNRGYSKAAQRLGSLFVQYRPSDTNAVIVENNIVQEAYFAFDRSQNFDFTQPLDYNVAKYYALVDLTSVQVGDYFYDYNQRTFFVSNIEPLRPAEVILCNETVSVFRPASSTTNGYGGNTTPQLLMQGIPVSLLPGTKGENNEAGTPGSIRSPWTQIRMPYIGGVQINAYDIITDSQSRRWVISMNSLAKEGWYITASYQSA